tara:strand:- start:10755 stop:10970 length:216 start_codon:yes stop_codon:yes gene_type:complete
MNNSDIIKQIPQEVLTLLNSGNLHKLASVRTGEEDFGLNTAVTHLGKKAFYQRRINKVIANGISSVSTLER